MMALPKEFTDQMKVLLGDEFPAFLASYDEPRKYALRVNTLKITPERFEQIAPFHLTKVPWIDGAYYYEEEDAVSRHPFYYAGLYYLQEPSAMTPASVLSAQPGEKVLDLCAAPGGKATALGAALKGQGLLVANDISASRVKALLKNIEVFGITNSLVTNTAPARLSEHFPGYFDKVLVDAPCSGEGMFRKDEAVIRAWYPEKPAQCAKIQKEIVLRAADMLRPGGQMLYSTCSFAPEENEEIIAYLLAQRPQMHLVKIPHREGFAPGLDAQHLAVWRAHGPEHSGDSASKSENTQPAGLPGEPDLTKCVRLWPHHIGGEGHFLALLEKEDMSHNDMIMTKRTGHFVLLEKPDRSSAKLLRQFSEETGVPIDPARVEVRKGQVFSPAIAAAEAAGIPFVRNGVYLGELKKDRFEPSQALAMSVNVSGAGETVYARLVLPQNDDRIIRYLKGETISLREEERQPGEKNGWVLVCAEGYPLGWAKKTGNLLKNKYHPGWRIKT